MYKIFILEKAFKELSKLSETDYEKIKEKIFSLQENVRPYGCKKLHGREGWRIRCGEYRIIYEINESKKEINILHIGPRRDVYR